MLLRSTLIVLLCANFIYLAEETNAQQLFRKFRSDMRQIGRSLAVKKRPSTGVDGEMENLARELDWLEGHINKFGSVVVKQPDIWGESRLTRYRVEYEKEMLTRLDQFQPRDNARITREDIAFLASATGISAALNRTAPDVSVSAASSSATEGATPATEDATPSEGTSASDDGTPTATDNNSNINPAKIEQTINVGNSFTPLQGSGLKASSNLEVTQELNQRSRYLNHLHQLRRINSGDDTSDAPGYSLNLVRVPVSISPGRETRRSHGAKVTITAKPFLGNTLLPETFKNLVINDVVDQLALPILKLAEDPSLPYLRAAVVFEKRYQKELRRIGELALALQSLPTGFSDFKIDEILEGIFEQGNLTLNLGAAKIMAEEAIRTFRLRESQVGIDKTSKAEITRQISDIEKQMSIVELAVVKLLKDQNNDRRMLPRVDAESLTEVQRKFALKAAISKKALELEPQELIAEIAKIKLQNLSGDFLALASGFRKIIRENKSKFSLNPTSRRRRSAIPIPQVLLTDVMDEAVLVVIAYEFAKSYNGQAVAWHQESKADKDSAPRVHLIDVRHYLRSTLEGAYRLLATDRNRTAVQNIIESGLHKSLEAAAVGEIALARKAFMFSIESNENKAFKINPVMRSFAWPLVTEMALLNEQLNREVHNIAVTKGDCGCHPNRRHAYYLPMPNNHDEEQADTEFLAAAEQFKRYVECRWPIHVFHIDPVTEDQNVSDSSVIGRELAIAVAVGVASGNINFRQANQFVRQYREQIDTIGLNRTVNGFSHGNDTFGWIFRPRVQTQPNRGTAVAFGETLFGRGPEANLRDAALEPGMRECNAIVLMPSFVPYCDFEVATSWFRLDNPRSQEISNHQTMKLSRSVKYMQDCAIQCAQNAHLYRDGDVNRLLNRVRQLEQELPLQSMRVQIPYENTLGGFELFNNGVTDLAPELVGWYGGRGVAVGDTETKTTIFLVGENFSVHDTKIIAGGQLISNDDVRLISRQVVQISIPSSAKTVNLKDELSELVDHTYVSVYAATPYGVTSHLHVPAYTQKKEKKVSEEVAELTKRVMALEESSKKSPFSWDKPPTLPVVASFVESSKPGQVDRCCFELGNIEESAKYTLKWNPVLSLPKVGNQLSQLKGGLAGQLVYAGKPVGGSFWITNPGEFNITASKKLEIKAPTLFDRVVDVLRSELPTDKTGLADVTQVELRTWVIPVLEGAVVTDGELRNHSTVIGDAIQTGADLKLQVSQRIAPQNFKNAYVVEPSIPNIDLPKLPPRSLKK